MKSFLEALDGYDKSGFAFISAGEKLTYGELIHSAGCLANDLSEDSTPVLVRGHKQSFMLIAFVACLMCGRAYVPCDSCFPRERVEYIRKITRSTAEINEKTKWGNKEITQYRGEGADTAYIIFTSGSSGEPKGVPISRDNLSSFITWLRSVDAVSSVRSGNVLNQARFSFDLSVADIYYSLSEGLTLCALTSEEQSSPALLSEKLTGYNPSFMVMTPTFAKYCLCLPEFSRAKLTELKTIFFCGEVLEPGTVRKLFSRFEGVRVINAYGPTEATCAVTCCEITPDMCSMKTLPCGDGKSSCGIEIEDGEIVLQGRSVFSGYVGSDKRITSYHTGDMGEVKDGLLYCRGRKSGYIKLAGHRIETEEIKNVILSAEGVLQCSVRPVYSSSGIVTALNCSVVAPGLTPEAIRNAISEFLPDYSIPGVIKVLDTIGISDNGKQKI